MVWPPWNMALNRLQKPELLLELAEEVPELWQPTLPRVKRPTSKSDQKRFMGVNLGFSGLSASSPIRGDSLVNFLRPIQPHEPQHRKGRRLGVWKKKRELVVKMPSVVKFPHLSGLTGYRDGRGYYFFCLKAKIWDLSFLPWV